MRILVLGINYWPEETGIAPFNTGRCEYLAGRGHDVTMSTAMPYYPQWRIPDAYRGKLLAREEQNGVTVLRSFLYVPRQVTSIRRIVHEASFVAASCLRSLGARRPDALVTVSPPLALGLASILLGKVWKVPYLFHVPDLQPDAAADLGMLKPGRVLRTLYALERLAYRHAGLISTLNESMRARIVSKGIPGDEVVLLPDWAEPELFDVPVRGGEAFRRDFGLGDRFIVLHAGNMGVKQGLDVILDAAERSRERDDIVYLLVGDGAVRPRLEQRSRSLPNVRVLPLQTRAVFLDMLAAADVSLVTQQRSVADIVFPSKVMTLLAGGCPVITSVSPTSEVSRAVTSARAGLSVAPEDAAALLEAVLTLRDDPGLRATMAANGRAYARTTWDRDKVLADMERELSELVARSGAHDLRAKVPRTTQPLPSGSVARTQ